MSNFIKLTSTVINKLHITKIIHHQNTYRLFLINNHFHGFNFGAIGYFYSKNMIELCETKNKKDYDTIKYFIDNL